MKARLAMIGVLAFALAADGQNVGELVDDDGSDSWLGDLAAEEPEPEPEPEARCHAPCLNGGACEEFAADGSGVWHCACAEGFQGATCAVAEESPPPPPPPPPPPTPPPPPPEEESPRAPPPPPPAGAAPEDDGSAAGAAAHPCVVLGDISCDMEWVIAAVVGAAALALCGFYRLTRPTHDPLAARSLYAEDHPLSPVQTDGDLGDYGLDPDDHAGGRRGSRKGGRGKAESGGDYNALMP